MHTSYPGALDDLDADLIPGSGANANVPLGEDGASAYTHPAHHATLAGAIEALEAKVGMGASTPTEGRFFTGTATGTSAWAETLVGSLGAAGVAGGSLGIVGGTGNDDNNTGASVFAGGGGAAGYASPGRVHILTGDTTGTAGQVLTAQGDGTALWKSGRRKDTVTLSSADLLDLHNTPVTLVAAPGAGKYLVPTHAVFSFTVGGGSTYNETLSSPTWGFASNGYTGLGTIGSGLSNGADENRLHLANGNAAMLTNEAIGIKVDGALTDGSHPATVIVYYTIEDVP